MHRLTIKNNHGQQMVIHGEAKCIDDNKYIIFYMNDRNKPFVVLINNIIELIPISDD